MINQSGKGTCTLRVSGTDLDRQKSPSLVSDWSIFMQMRTSSPQNLIGLKGSVLIGQNGATWVSENVVADTAVQLRLAWESLSPSG